MASLHSFTKIAKDQGEIGGEVISPEDWAKTIHSVGACGKLFKTCGKLWAYLGKTCGKSGEKFGSE